MSNFREGFVLGLYTISTATILDNTISINYTKDFIKKNTDLYIKGLRANYLNLLVLSPIYYTCATNYLANVTTKTKSLYVIDYTLLVLIHNMLYYLAHKNMHLIPQLRNMHNFHHLFKNPVASSANAVSTSGFTFAYILPFIFRNVLCSTKYLYLKMRNNDNFLL